MLKKILKKKQPTEKVGKSMAESSTAEDLIPHIIVSDSDTEYVAELINRVTIGSKVGDLIIDNDKLSPRHCTFFCNKGVFSLIDHASQSGTYINKRKIEPNKIYILDQSDKFKIGKLELQITLREKAIDPDLIEKVVDTPANINVSDDEVDDKTRELSPELLKQFGKAKESGDQTSDELSLEEEISKEDFSPTEIRAINQSAENESTLVAKKMPIIPSKESIIDSREEKLILKESGKEKKVKEKKKKKKKKQSVKISRESSSSALTRVIAFINDILITYIVVEVFSVFAEFRSLYNELPEELSSLIMPILSPQIETLSLQYPSLVENLTVQVNGLPKTKEAFEFFLFFFLLKITTSLIFSISAGQALAGMKVVGNFLWKRLVAPIRSLLGIILFPFLIFDLPTIFSKRSFKEVMTRTQFVTRGGILSLLSKIFVTPILLIAALIAPMYQGFEELAPITITQDVKVDPPYKYLNPTYVQSLNLTFEDSGNSKVLPVIDLKIKNRKEMLSSGAFIINSETGASFQIKKLKTFSFQEFFKSFVDENPASPQFQPEIYGLVRNVANNNNNFNLKVKNKNKLIAEVIELVKDSFGVSLLTLPEFVVKNGVFVGAFRDFREKLNSLYDVPPEEIKLINLGGSPGIFASHGQGRMRYHTFIPVGGIEGIMYRIEGNITTPKLALLKRQLKFTNKAGDELPRNVAEYINLSHEGLVKDNVLLNQEVYSRYYEVSQALLARDDFKNLDIVQMAITQFINILNLDNKSNQKLTQNLSELLQALKDENKEFFSISETEVI